MRLFSRSIVLPAFLLLALFLFSQRGSRRVPQLALATGTDDLAAAKQQNLSPSLVGKHSGSEADVPLEDDEDDIMLFSDVRAANASRAALKKRKKPEPAGTGAGPAAPNEQCFNVEGYRGCGYFNAAVKLGEKAEAELGVAGTRRKTARRKDGTPFPPVRLLASAYHRNQWAERLQELRKEIEGGEDHRTSPLIYIGCSDTSFKYVGGFEDFQRMMWEKYDV